MDSTGPSLPSVEASYTTTPEGEALWTRLERERDDLVDRYGARLYELLRAGAIWRPYQMLGKLLPIAYLLKVPASDP